jgi:hypothetical protein
MSLVALSEKALLLTDGRVRSFGPTKDLLQPKAPQQVSPAVSDIRTAGTPAAAQNGMPAAARQAI